MIAEGGEDRVDPHLVRHRQRSVGKRRTEPHRLVDLCGARDVEGDEFRRLVDHWREDADRIESAPHLGPQGRPTALVGIVPFVDFALEFLLIYQGLDALWARITSTNGMSIGGLKKCIPTTLWGRFVARAMLVIGKADVFDARIASFGAARSSSRNTRFFRSRSSKMASITIAASRVAWARS